MKDDPSLIWLYGFPTDFDTGSRHPTRMFVSKVDVFGAKEVSVVVVSRRC